MQAQDNTEHDFGALSAEQILAAFEQSAEHDAALAAIQTRAEAIASQASANAADSRRALRLADLRAYEHERDDRMQVYRAIADRRVHTGAEDDPLDKVLAHALALARGGEIEAAASLAKVAGAIARAAKTSALAHAPSGALVHFVLPSQKKFDECATITVNTTVARASLAKLIDHALSGDTIIIQRANRPIARLVPYWPDDSEESEPPPVARGAAGTAA